MRVSFGRSIRSGSPGRIPGLRPSRSSRSSRGKEAPSGKKIPVKVVKPQKAAQGSGLAG